MTATDWRAEARCSDDPTPDRFHVSEKNRHGIEAAKAVCRGCQVVAECLAEALADPHLTGVWGGTTETERVNIRRRRARKQRKASA